MTQLLVTLEIWTDWLDRGEPLDVIYLDFKPNPLTVCPILVSSRSCELIAWAATS